MEISSTNAALASLLTQHVSQTGPSRQENQVLIRAVRKVNESELLGRDNELTFVLDRETRKTLVRIVSKETREVIQQIPPEYILRLAEDLA